MALIGTTQIVSLNQCQKYCESVIFLPLTAIKSLITVRPCCLLVVHKVRPGFYATIAVLLSVLLVILGSFHTTAATIANVVILFPFSETSSSWAPISLSA